MTDIVERLRERPSRYASETEEQAKERRQQEREEAADTIATLRATNERLVKALEKMQRSRDRYRQAWEDEKARAALAQEKKNGN